MNTEKDYTNLNLTTTLPGKVVEIRTGNLIYRDGEVI